MDTYRRVSTAVLVSIFLNVCLGVAIYYVYSGQPAPDFYATDGVTPPVPLVAMDQPNESLTPLLANDQNDSDSIKTTPQ